MKEKEENEEEKNLKTNLDTMDDNINKIELFNKIIKQIDKDILKDKNPIEINDNKLINGIHNYFLELFSENKNLLEIKNKFGNNLSQYYLSYGQIILSLEIINICYEICNKIIDGEKQFIDFLINDNNNEKNLFEIGVELQSNMKDIIYFYKHLFELVEKLKNNYIFYHILEKRKENIFILCIKEEKYFLFLFLWEKIKKYYPSSNPLDIKNKLGLAPLHISSYYLNREITDMLLISGCNVNIEDNKKNTPLHFAVKGGDLSIVKKLIFYGADKSKLNDEKLTPSDYAQKYRNSSMRNILSNNPFKNITSIKERKYAKIFIFIFLGNIFLKFKIDKVFWKSYISDFFCFLCFLDLVLKSKDYYIFNNENNIKNNKDVKFEDIFIQCNYDKNKIKKICSKCKIIKKFRTKHCIVCDCCVEDFDHHCFWINKCINSKIFIEFFIFLILTILCFIINSILFSFELKRIMKNKSISKDYSYYILLSFLILYLFIYVFGIFIVGSLIYQRISEKILAKKKMTLEDNLINIKNIEEENGNKININN